MAQQDTQAAGSGTQSDHQRVPGQALKPLAVCAPMGIAGSGNAAIVVEVYAMGRGVTFARQGDDLPLAQGAFELEAHGVRLVVDPLRADKAQWLVAAVERDIAPIGQLVKAVHQEGVAEIGSGCTHEEFSLKTAILNLPQGSGKTLFAPGMAARLGCTQVVDEWSPSLGVTPGALHLTNAEVTA